MQNERKELTTLLCKTISRTLNEYAEKNPRSKLKVEDVRVILVKIIDYLDIAEISGFGPWKD